MGKPLDPKLLTADFGNATATLVDADGKVVLFTPSIMTQIGVRAYTGKPSVVANGGHITLGNEHAVVGLPALDYHGVDTLLQELPGEQAHQRYTATRTKLAMLALIGSAIPEPQTIAIDLRTNAPVRVVADHAAAITKALTGVYDVCHQGRPRRIILASVTLFAEGGIHLLSLLPDAKQYGKVALWDVGGGTHGLLLANNGMVRYHDTLAPGIERLLDGLGVNRDASVRWQLRQDMRRNSKAHKDVRDGLSASITANLDAYAVKVPWHTAERHVLFGGGAYDLADVLRKDARSKDAEIIIIDEPETANARAMGRA
jgi:hypothetical protein